MLTGPIVKKTKNLQQVHYHSHAQTKTLKIERQILHNIPDSFFFNLDRHNVKKGFREENTLLAAK